jgi:hypothetical protein
MSRNAILSSLVLMAGVLCLNAWADDQSSPPKSGKSDGIAQPDQAAPGAGMMSKGTMGRRMMGKGMMGVPMKERRMKMMQMHQKMQEDMKAMDAENDKLVTEMNAATGQKKIDAMATLLTRLVAQRKLMVEKMGAMHSDMMQMMMEDTGTAREPAVTDDKETAHDQSAAVLETEHMQHQQ